MAEVLNLGETELAILTLRGQRFPADFMFQFDQDEWAGLKSQIVTSNRGGIRQSMPPPASPKNPIGFTADIATTKGKKP